MFIIRWPCYFVHVMKQLIKYSVWFVVVATKLNFSSSCSLTACYWRRNHMFQSQSWYDMTCTQYCKYECACIWNITWTQFVLNWRVFGVFWMCECVWDKTMIKYYIVCVYVWESVRDMYSQQIDIDHIWQVGPRL